MMHKSLLIAPILALLFAAGCAEMNQSGGKYPAGYSTTITGYGEGATMAEATKAAWANAREKLAIGGLTNYVLLDEQLLRSATGPRAEVILQFKAVPADSIDVPASASHRPATRPYDDIDK